jgi:outer membrane biosynthesis protein TonB
MNARHVLFAILVAVTVVPLRPITAHAVAGCVGDCGTDGKVTVNEIVAMVNIALGTVAVTACEAGDVNQDNEVTINEIVAAVQNALNGCVSIATPTPTATDTPPPSTDTPSPTPTATDTPTSPAAATDTPTPPPTQTATPPPTVTSTEAPSATPTPTSTTIVPTPTATLTVTPTATPATTTTRTPTATPGGVADQIARVAGRTTLAVDSVTVLSNVIGALANGIQFGKAAQVVGLTESPLAAGPGGEAAGTCPLGGTASKSGEPIFGETVTLTQCMAATSDGSVHGSVTFQGSITFGLFVSLNVNVTATFKDHNGVILQTAVAQLQGSASPTLGGDCALTQASFMLTGTMSTTTNGTTVGVNFNTTEVTVSNITFNSSCVPTVYDISLNRGAALLDPQHQAQPVTFNQLVVHVASSGSSTMLTVNGGIQSTCFGGTAALTTQTPLTVPSGDNCPTAGVINVVLSPGQAQAQVTFNTDMSVVIQGAGIGPLMAPNCLDPGLLMCAA